MVVAALRPRIFKKINPDVFEGIYTDNLFKLTNGVYSIKRCLSPVSAIIADCLPLLEGVEKPSFLLMQSKFTDAHFPPSTTRLISDHFTVFTQVHLRP